MKTHVLLAIFQTLLERSCLVHHSLALCPQVSGDQFLGETIMSYCTVAVRIPTDIIVQSHAVGFSVRISIRAGLKNHFGAVVRIRSNLKLAAVGVEGELLECHGAEEGDLRGLARQYILVRIYPDTL